MSRLRSSPPAQLLGSRVTVTDLAPDNDVLILRFDGGRVVVRPSGTEPKCKAYLELVLGEDSAPDPAGREAEADRALSRLGDEVTAALAL